MRAALIPLVLLASGLACERRPDARPPEHALPVAVSLHPVASLVREIGGPAVSVRTLLPPGAHADTYEATPRVAEALSGARLVVRVGGAVDAWLAGRGRADEVILTRDGNPHVWLDPIRVRDEIVPVLADALVERVPDAEPEIRRRAAALADSLAALDAEIRAILAGVRTRRFVSAHPAWVHFAARYGLTDIGSLHPSPGTELGARELARLVDAARAEGGVAVIAEPQLGRAGVDALARELRVPVEVADPVGGEGVEGREDYLSLMRYNARAFARALGASP